MKDSLARGEAPFASHLLYTQILDDDVPEQRTQGIEAGFEWGRAADASVFYFDRGFSNGMRLGLKAARAAGRRCFFRLLDYVEPLDFAEGRFGVGNVPDEIEAIQKILKEIGV